MLVLDLDQEPACVEPDLVVWPPAHHSSNEFHSNYFNPNSQVRQGPFFYVLTSLNDLLWK